MGDSLSYLDHLLCKHKVGGVAEWFKALDLKSGGNWFKSSTLPTICICSR